MSSAARDRIKSNKVVKITIVIDDLSKSSVLNVLQVPWGHRYLAGWGYVMSRWVQSHLEHS